MSGEACRRTGGVFKESAEMGDDMEPTFGLDFQAIKDWRKAVRNRATFVGPDLPAGPVEKRKIVFKL